VELLKNSPYKDNFRSTQLFLPAVRDRSKEIPNLISPHLGDRVSASLTVASAVGAAAAAAPEQKPAGNAIAVLPHGGRSKVDPWNDQLRRLSPSPWGSWARQRIRRSKLRRSCFA